MGNRKRIVRRVLIGLAVVIVIAICGIAWYVNDYYHADDTALAALADADGDADGVVVKELAGNAYAFVPDAPIAGLIFYPGAKVQPEAYAPLAECCAKQGVLCVVVRPPFNLAIFDANAADGMQAQFPDMDSWFIAGHSLGGVVACDYLLKHVDEYDGLVLLASYPASDLSQFRGKVVSIYGSNDQVMKRDNYENAKENLPASSSEIIIPGGNHAQFGNYGAQIGDGEATIASEAQQMETADVIAELVA